MSSVTLEPSCGITLNTSLVLGLSSALIVMPSEMVTLLGSKGLSVIAMSVSDSVIIPLSLSESSTQFKFSSNVESVSISI